MDGTGVVTRSAGTGRPTAVGASPAVRRALQHHALVVARRLRTVLAGHEVWVSTGVWTGPPAAPVRADIAVIRGTPPPDGFVSGPRLAVRWEPGPGCVDRLLRAGACLVWAVTAAQVDVHAPSDAVFVARPGDRLPLPDTAGRLAVEDVLLPTTVGGGRRALSG